MNDQTIKRFFSAPRALRLYGVRRGAMMLLATVLLTMTAQTVWADNDNVTLSVDDGISEGTVGHYYYNMPGYTQGKTVHHTLTISEQDITDGKVPFKVYDNGGKDGPYGYTIRAYLTITAPEGKVVKVNGTVITYTDGSWDDFMYIYDGANNTAPKFKNGDSEKFCSQGYKSAVDVQSSGNSITLYFETDGQSGTVAAGLDLTVEINDPTYDIRKAAVTGIQSEYSYTGSVIPINYSVHAYSSNELLTKDTHYTETITKGDEAANVIEEGDYTVTITGKSPYYGSQSFDFTVWKSLTQDGSEWYITIPTKRKRTLTITQADIAAGITAFKVYHADGKERVWGKNWDGVLAINVPEGYLIQLSGVVRAAKYTNNELTFNGILTVYDNNEASGTTLLENTNLVYDNNDIASATIPSNVLSTGQNMAIRYQVENDYTDIDLTATLIPDNREFNITVSNSITGGSVTSNLSQAKGNDEVTLTVTSEEGYMLNELTVTDADGGTVNVTDCNWYTDWNNKTSKTATFSMPTKAVTVAATFTNILSSADGGLYVNMPHAGTKNVIIPDNITSFKLYDDGGKDGVFQCYSNGTMVISAPSGKLLQISGKSFLTNSLISGHSNYAIFNGTPENSGEQMAYNNQEQEVTLSPVVSEGNTIYVSFSASDNNDPDDNKYGLDMTVEVITPAVYNISIDNDIEHGSVSLDKTQATNNETVNVTVTPDEGYVLKEISVSDAGGAIAMTKPATDQWGDAVYYTATSGYSFKVRSSDATVTATFMPKTDFYVNIPKTDQRDFSIPDGTASFKVYDNSGKTGSYFTNDDGKLLLTAPEGYVMNVSGYVKLYYSSNDEDYLDIYDGNITSATSLGRFKDTSGNNNTFTQKPVAATSSTNQMLLHFVTNNYGYVDNGGGVYLTVTLVPISGVTLSNAGGQLTATLDASSETTVSITDDIVVKGVTLSRTFTANQPATVMLPFSLGDGQTVSGGSFYKFSGVEKDDDVWKAKFTEVAAVKCNTPYLFKPSADGSITFDLNGGTVTLNTTTASGETGNTTTNWEFHGTYQKVMWNGNTGGNTDPSDLDKTYGFAKGNGTTIAAGQFVHFAAGASLKPMRCYLVYNGSTEGGTFQNARRWTRGAGSTEELPQTITVVFMSSNGETTSIGTLDTRTGEISTDGWYSMDGRKLDGKPTKKGLYINNGRKVVIK